MYAITQKIKIKLKKCNTFSNILFCNNITYTSNNAKKIFSKIFIIFDILGNLFHGSKNQKSKMKKQHDSILFQYIIDMT